jgi:RimJ/RimL family protein N-acetyltransferase
MQETLRMELRGERVTLRRWRDTDRAAMASMHADPAVMEYLGEPMSADESDALIALVDASIERDGYGLWAVEPIGGDVAVGWCGLNRPSFRDDVELAWRLARDAWGHGYATDAARVAIGVAFGPLGLDEVVAFTTVDNLRSQAVMERLGMSCDPADDFDHPNLADGDPLRRHVLYRLAAPPTRS